MFKQAALFSTALTLFLAGTVPSSPISFANALQLDIAEDSNRNWFGMTANREGDQLNAITFHGDIYRSENGGKSWKKSTHFERAKTEGKNFVDIASNGKGDTVYAAEFGGAIWKSENGGMDWKMINAAKISEKKWSAIAKISEKKWSAIATNEEGNIVIASVDAENLWVSKDYGKTWQEKTEFPANENHPWIDIACNFKGDKMVAVADKGGLYTSSDFGETWEENMSFDKTFRWYTVDMNDDGNRLYATAESKLWISDNFGKTWTQKTIKTAEEGDKEDEWIAGFSYVSCNGKGNAITFTTEYDNIYLSNDYGETFSPILEPELASEFPWAYPIVNKNGIGLTVGQSSGIIFSTREKLTDEKDYLVIENASEIEEKLNQFIIDEIETVQNELDEKKMNELKDTIDDVDREIYGTDNIYFEKTGVEERDYEEVFAEILANANINANM